MLAFHMLDERPDTRLRIAFDLRSVASIEQAIQHVFDTGKTPQAIEIGWRDWGPLEAFARGLGSHPSFLRWPIERVERLTSAIRLEERADD